MEKQANKFIQPDPQAMDKVPAQMMIYDGAGWLEISNQQTINNFSKITTNLSDEASKTRESCGICWLLAVVGNSLIEQGIF